MSLIFSQLLDGALSEQVPFDQIWFASEQGVPPSFSYQVNFPRLELVFSGEYLNQIWDREEGVREISVLPGQALYIPPQRLEQAALDYRLLGAEPALWQAPAGVQSGEQAP